MKCSILALSNESLPIIYIYVTIHIYTLLDFISRVVWTWSVVTFKKGDHALAFDFTLCRFYRCRLWSNCSHNLNRHESRVCLFQLEATMRQQLNQFINLLTERRHYAHQRGYTNIKWYFYFFCLILFCLLFVACFRCHLLISLTHTPYECIFVHLFGFRSLSSPPSNRQP